MHGTRCIEQDFNRGRFFRLCSHFFFLLWLISLSLRPFCLRLFFKQYSYFLRSIFVSYRLWFYSFISQLAWRHCVGWTGWWHWVVCWMCCSVRWHNTPRKWASQRLQFRKIAPATKCGTAVAMYGIPGTAILSSYWDVSNSSETIGCDNWLRLFTCTV
jgi:hypothetical protein